MAAVLKAYASAAWRTITGAGGTFVKAWVAGAWVEIQFIRAAVRNGNNLEWKDVYVKSGVTPPAPPPPVSSPPAPTPTGVALRVAVTPTSVSGSRAGAGNCVTAGVVAVASKGTGPYTYKWSLVSYSSTYSANTPSAVSPNSANTTFQRTMGNAHQTEIARFRCRATDSLGNKGSAVVDVTFISVPTGSTPPISSPPSWYDPDPDNNLP